MKYRSVKNPLLLFTAALVWGVAFVAQKDGMQYVGPLTYTSSRFLLGGVCLLAALPALDRFRAGGGDFEKGSARDICRGGIVCGAVLCASSLLQQYGIALQDPATNVGKAGFITACYCAGVPILGLFTGKRSPLLVWVGVAVALVGFFFLCLMDGVAAGQGLGLGLSDLLLLLCAVGFSVHILVIDKYTPLADGVRISCVQFLTAGLLALPFALWLERPAWADIWACALPIGYAGIMSSAVGYTLQVVGQKGVHPAVASLILSLESVVSVLAGYVLQPGAGLTGWEILGCVLVFAAVVMVQLAPQKEDAGRHT